MADYFYLDPDYMLDPNSRVHQLSDHAFRWGWLALIAAAAEREDTYFEEVDLALVDEFTDDTRAALVEIGLLIPEGDGYRLSSEGWAPENEGAY